jgi:hypothetical protein
VESPCSGNARVERSPARDKPGKTKSRAGRSASSIAAPQRERGESRRHARRGGTDRGGRHIAGPYGTPSAVGRLLADCGTRRRRLRPAARVPIVRPGGEATLGTSTAGFDGPRAPGASQCRGKDVHLARFAGLDRSRGRAASHPASPGHDDPDRYFRHMLKAAHRSKLVSMYIARALRFAGYPLVFAVGEPLWTRPFSADHHMIGSARFPAWAAAYLVFAVSFHLSASMPESARVPRVAMLGLMTLATLTMAALITCPLGALTLVVLASHGSALPVPATYRCVRRRADLGARRVDVESLGLGRGRVEPLPRPRGGRDLRRLRGSSGASNCGDGTRPRPRERRAARGALASRSDEPRA